MMKARQDCSGGRHIQRWMELLPAGGNDQDRDLARRIEELAQQEIPVVTVEEDIENASRAAYIGPDPAEVG